MDVYRMVGTGLGNLSIGVLSQESTSLDGAFVSVTSDEMVDHGRSDNGSVRLTAESNSMVTVTVHHRGYQPQTKVFRLSSNRLRHHVKVTERTVYEQSGEYDRHAAKGEPSPLYNREEIEEAHKSLEAISEELSKPQSVYRQVLLAHQSLCTGLGSIERIATRESVHGQNEENQVNALGADIETLESYADLLATNLDVLVEACNSIGKDEEPTQSDFSPSELKQISDFITNFRDLPRVGKSDGLNNESLARFGEFIGEWADNHEDSEEKGTPLLREIERLADELNRVPSHDDVRKHGHHGLNMYYDQFGSWSDVIEATEIDHRQMFSGDVWSVSQKLGDQPTVAEYDVHGEYTANRLKSEFGSWSKTLEAVDFDDCDEPRSSPSEDKAKTNGRREKMLSLIIELHDELDRVPKASHLPKDAAFNRQDYLDQFGGWYDAVEAAELDYRAELLQDIRDVSANLAYSPNTVEMDDHGHYDHTDVYQFFDTWGEAKEAAMEDVQAGEIIDESTGGSAKQTTTDDEEREEMLSVLTALYDDLGRVPRASHLPQDAPFSRQDYLDQFGGWYDAVKAAELDFQAEILQDIRDVAADLGHFPDTTEMDDHGRYNHNDAYQFFDTWDEAIEVAIEVTEAAEMTNDKSTSDSAEQSDTEGKHEDMLSIIVDLYNDLGRVPKATHLSEDAPVTPQDYVNEFGGWYNAIELAGLNHRDEVLQEIRDVTAELGSPPTTVELSEHGRYDSGDVYRHFDTWSTAKEAAGVDESTGEVANNGTVTPGQDGRDGTVSKAKTKAERELFETIRTVAQRLGRSPSLNDLFEHSRYDLNDVYDQFESWHDLKELAGVSTQASVEKLIGENSATESTDESEEIGVPPSELVELYEVFLRLSRTVDEAVKASDRSVQESPMATWREALHQFVQDGIDGWKDGYGPQEDNKQDTNIQEYRDVYGDGEHVTDFPAIETAPIDPVVEAVLDRIDIDEQVQSLRLPVAPDSSVALPVFVESDQELETAEALLAEFPENPSVDGWEWVSSRDEREPDEGQEADDGGADDVTTTVTEELLDVSGVTESEADSLYVAGFKSVKDLQSATVDEIGKTNGISSQLALRIKADIGGR